MNELLLGILLFIVWVSILFYLPKVFEQNSNPKRKSK